MAKADNTGVRQLPNGMQMKEASVDDEYTDFTVEKVLGTRLEYGIRSFLIKFKGYKILEWVNAEGCGDSKDAIMDFKKSMGWTRLSTAAGVEHLHPDLLKKAPVAGDGPSSATRRKSSASAPTKRKSSTTVEQPPAAKRSKSSDSAPTKTAEQPSASGHGGNDGQQTVAAAVAAPQKKYRLQEGVGVHEVLGVTRKNGVFVAQVHYEDGEMEKGVPTSLIADLQPIPLFKFYESHIVIHY